MHHIFNTPRVNYTNQLLARSHFSHESITASFLKIDSSVMFVFIIHLLLRTWCYYSILNLLSLLHFIWFTCNAHKAIFLENDVRCFFSMSLQLIFNNLWNLQCYGIIYIYLKITMITSPPPQYPYKKCFHFYSIIYRKDSIGNSGNIGF